MTAVEVAHVDGTRHVPYHGNQNKRGTGVLIGREIELTVDQTSNKIAKTAEKATASSSQQKTYTPLEKHALIFADENGNITWNSIYNRLISLHMGWIEAGIFATGIQAIITLANGTFSSINAVAAAHLINKQGSSMFLEDGSINKDELESTLNYAQHGKDFLSEIDINKMLENYKKKASVAGYMGAAKEYELLLRSCCDHWEKIDGKYVPCLKKKTIEQFYIDAEVLFKDVKSNNLPIAKPV